MPASSFPNLRTFGAVPPSAPSPGKPVRVGLTGGIASGKSMITDFLKAQGVQTIDADEVVHALLREDEALKAEIRQAFGADVFAADGQIDRQRLAGVVFNDTDKRKQLEGMIHPRVRQRIETFFTGNLAEKLVVAVIPLLFESNLQDAYDVVWLVKATEDQQAERLVTRRGMTREEALARIRSQLPLNEKLARLQVLHRFGVIDNTGSVEETQRQVGQLVLDLLT